MALNIKNIEYNTNLDGTINNMNKILQLFFKKVKIRSIYFIFPILWDNT